MPLLAILRKCAGLYRQTRLIATTVARSYVFVALGYAGKYAGKHAEQYARQHVQQKCDQKECAMDKAIIDVIRENEQLPDHMTDSEIAKEYKGTYTAARAAISLDHTPLDQQLADATARVLPFMKKKK